jgi:hypothetical protein
LAIEQNGPYGRDALTNSHFPVDIANELASRLDGLRVRPALVRAPGKHPDQPANDCPRTVLVASSHPKMSWLRRFTIRDPTELLDIDFRMVFAADDMRAASGLPDSAERVDSALLVCTHARRDICCAVKGRPVATELASDPRFSPNVWETSHLGGHRFAATAVQLPHGWVYGRLDAHSAATILTDSTAPAPRMNIDHARGRSYRSQPAQAAELAVRTTVGYDAIDGLTVEAVSDPELFKVSVPANGTSLVKVECETTEATRQESCGTPKMPVQQWKTTLL